MDGIHPPAHAAEPTADGHYMKAVAEVGDSRRLIVVHPIYSATGIKLLDSGAALSSRTVERLVGHRLAAPLEQSVAAEEALQPAAIVARARELADANPLLARVVAGAGGAADRLWSRLAGAPLPASVLFRLTVAREKFAALYDHSLRAAATALAIGTGARLPDRELALLATAGLMHDFGMLHADPARFDNDQPLDPAGRRQLRAHPLTGMLIAQREPQLNPAIATAILQHHERLDGSGYPSAPGAEHITRLARILMLVELVLAVAEHDTALPELRLSLMLRANHRSFDRSLVSVLLAALPGVASGDAVDSDARAAVDRLSHLCTSWKAAAAAAKTGAQGPIVEYIETRLARLRRLLAEAGIQPAAGLPDEIAADPAALAELGGLAREALWHVRQIASDLTLRWPELAHDEPGSADAALRAWIHAAGQAATARAEAETA
jgi:HD-GYP domain-containing protein (c-di-GMP phosphodiesterase class II)